METFDVFFTSEGIELETAVDYHGYTRHTGKIPHIPASEAMAEGNYDFPHQERDIVNHMLEHGLSIHGLYAEDTIATTN